MYKSTIDSIQRTFLIEVASASEYSGEEKIKTFIKKMVDAGQYTEAKEEEIEELDNIMDDLEV